MDVVPHPDFGTNRLIYLSYGKPNEDGSMGTTTVVRDASRAITWKTRRRSSSRTPGATTTTTSPADGLRPRWLPLPDGGRSTNIPPGLSRSGGGSSPVFRGGSPPAFPADPGGVLFVAWSGETLVAARRIGASCGHVSARITHRTVHPAPTGCCARPAPLGQDCSCQCPSSPPAAPHDRNTPPSATHPPSHRPRRRAATGHRPRRRRADLRRQRRIPRVAPGIPPHPRGVADARLLEDQLSGALRLPGDTAGPVFLGRRLRGLAAGQ